MTTVYDLMKQVKLLSIADQRVLNKLLCQNIRHAQKVVAIEKSAAIDIGDYVQFNAKTRGIITMKVSDFSRDGSKVKGTQVNKGFGRATRGMKWQCAASMVKVITKTEGQTIESNTSY
jgi:hypothetical protein